MTLEMQKRVDKITIELSQIVQIADDRWKMEVVQAVDMME